MRTLSNLTIFSSHKMLTQNLDHHPSLSSLIPQHSTTMYTLWQLYFPTFFFLMFQAVNACIDGCARVYPIMQDALVKNVKRQFLTKETTVRWSKMTGFMSYVCEGGVQGYSTFDIPFGIHQETEDESDESYNLLVSFTAVLSASPTFPPH
jgi:hypothetical protein